VADAVRTHKTALRLRPNRASLYFHLATISDEHYRGKVPAARHYRRFLEAAEQSRPELRRYAESRLQTLRSTLHMQTGIQSSSRRTSEDDSASDDGE